MARRPPRPTSIAGLYGIEDEWLTWQSIPSVFGVAVIARAEQVAHALQNHMPESAHSQCLDVVARASGMESWDDLQHRAQALTLGGQRGDQTGKERCSALASVLPMMVGFQERSAVRPQQRVGMEVFASSLARVARLPETQARDVVAEANGASNWDALYGRRQDKSALYGFEVINGDGRFVPSEHCETLIAQVSRHEQALLASSAVVQGRSFEAVLDLAEERRDLLDAWAVVAAHGEWTVRLAGDVRRAIEHAESTMPRRFRGRVAWLHQANRPYLQMLHEYMVWSAFRGHAAQALQLAEKQLRCNPQDHFGVRYWLPLLLAARGEQARAAEASARLVTSDELNPQCWVAAGVAAWRYGDHNEARRCLLWGCMLMPGLRWMLGTVVTVGQLGQTQRIHRGALPDIRVVRSLVEVADARLVSGGGPSLRGSVQQWAAEDEFVQILPQASGLLADRSVTDKAVARALRELIRPLLPARAATKPPQPGRTP